ncbi:MAG TPA: helix-turn-helix domain-containing protein [Methylomirabilota bacterium]|jgi:hypothetical protein|nr:helix-turn-helix domain-containing protein [Methylomirabilota bacterium]
MKKLRKHNANGSVRLTARQEQAFQALLAGASVQEAAQRVRIGRTTLYRWLNNETFRAAYHAAQDRTQAWTAARLQSLAAKAIQTLERILDNASILPSVQMEAARIVLEFALLSKHTPSQRPPLGAALSEFALPSLHHEPGFQRGRAAAEHAARHNPFSLSLGTPLDSRAATVETPSPKP